MTYVVIATIKYSDRFTHVAVEWGRLHNAFLVHINMKTADTSISRFKNARGFFTNIRRWQVTYCRRQLTWDIHYCHCHGVAVLRVHPTENISQHRRLDYPCINEGQHTAALPIQPRRQAVHRVISPQVERSESTKPSHRLLLRLRMLAAIISRLLLS